MATGWVALILVGAVAFWWIAKIAAAYFVSPELSGLALLKKELRNNGVDVKRIPDAALREIVANTIRGAKGLAIAANYSSTMPNDTNWRANLVRHLQAEANVIRLILAEGPERKGHFDSTPTLLKYGVIRPEKTNE